MKPSTSRSARARLFVLGSCLLATGAAQAAEPRYNFTALDAFGGSFSAGRAINKAGRVVGVAATPEDASTDPPSEDVRAASWIGSVATELRSLGGGTGYANGINSAGVIVGDSWLADGQGVHATRWVGGIPEDLGTLGGSQSSAFGVNKLGIVIGQASTANGQLYGVFWRQGAIMRLPTLAGAVFCRPQGISDTNLLAGWCDLGDTRVAVTWQAPAKIKRLATLHPGESYALGINAAGLAVGYSPGPSGYVHATSWAGSKVQDLGTLGGVQSIATGVNDAGVVVGYSSLPGLFSNHAVLWRAGSIVDLNDHLDAGTRAAGWVLVEANAINARGDITGSAVNTQTRQSRGFVLTVQNQRSP